MEERRNYNNRPDRKFNGPRRFTPRAATTERKFIIGRQPIIESFSSDTNIEKILIQKNAQGEGLSEIKKAALDNNIPIQLVPIEKLNGMTKANHQGVLAFISMVKYMDLQEVIDFVVAKGEIHAGAGGTESQDWAEMLRIVKKSLKTCFFDLFFVGRKISDL